MERKTLPLKSIRSQAKFVIYSEKDGLISEHEKLADAMRRLALHIGADLSSRASIYERWEDGWDKAF